MTSLTSYQKTRISLRYRLQGLADANHAFIPAIQAFDFAEKCYGNELRKDGITPGFMHALEVTGFAVTQLRNLVQPGEQFAVCLLHDVLEDHGVSFIELRDHFGEDIAMGCLRMSKIQNGRKLSNEEYFRDMLTNRLAVAAKGFDRTNNQQTMIGVFSEKKQQEYITETQSFILPMIKQARRLYPEQEALFEMLKLVLKNQVLMVGASLPAQRN